MHGLLDGGAQADAVVADRRWCARRCFLDFGACTAAGRQHFACQMAARAGDFLGKPFDILDGQVERHFTDEPDLFVRAARFGRCAQDVDFGVRRLRGWQPAVAPPQDRYPPTDWPLPNVPKYCHPARMLTTCLVAASATTWQWMSTLGGTH